MTTKPTKLAGREPGSAPPGKIKGLLYGAPGVGKTWFATAFPRPYYIDTEAGADLAHYQERLKNAGGLYLGPPDGTLDFEFVISQAQALAVESHTHQTLILDSLTKLWGTTILNEQERLQEKDVFGASKKPAIRQMRRLLNWATKLDMNIWFVAHEVAEWAQLNGQRQEIGRGPDCWDKVPYELHLCLRVEKRGNSRVATVKKSRLLGFPEGETFPLEYSEFATRYGKDFIEAPPKPIVLATPEQVEEINRLLSIVKVAPEDVEKVRAKANAESWTELNETQAAATIAWLLKKIQKN